MYWLLCNSWTKHRLELIFKEKRLYSIFVLLQVSVNKIIYTAIYIKQCLCLLSNIVKKNGISTVKQMFLLYTQYKRNLVRQTTGLGKSRLEGGDKASTVTCWWLWTASGLCWAASRPSWWFPGTASFCYQVCKVTRREWGGLFSGVSSCLRKHLCLKSFTCWFPRSRWLYRSCSGDGRQRWIGTAPCGTQRLLR